nr:trna ligase 1 [Quercus suber]
MAHRNEAPFRPQDPNEVAAVVRSLEEHKGKGKSGFSCKKHTFDVKGTDIKLHSWRFMEWDYKKTGLPTYARGLFTARNSKGDFEIAVRGYDKFFNHGEVPETNWQNVMHETRGPYELSVKENGCIIFMAGLEDGTLAVCSKHSIGARGDTDVSHSEVGERWVERHLERIGKSKQQLAQRLRAMNATAVAELCDDEFEEHVLQYTPEASGLYLHGLNLNLPEFATYPHHLVDRFADEWGLKTTTYLVKEDINEVKDFLDNVAETGNYDGRDTEGFVIRCQSKAKTGEWHDWFFKYKFEEPYLMYRQWRECTKAVIANRQPKYRQHKKITEEYLDFARRQLHGNPRLAAAYNQNHGIIKMRDDFLASRGLKGSDIIRQEALEGQVESDDVTSDVVLVPVATIGCGKTTVALALCKLFGWGHVQNDNITVKKGKPQAFATACVSCLANDSAMIADRNNHQRREREQLISDVLKIVPHARFVALHYVHDRAQYDKIRQVTQHRVLDRGDNHQTIHVGKKGSREIIGIMEGFLERFQHVNPEQPPDDGFDTIINLDVSASSRENLETVITQLYNNYPRLFGDQTMPDASEMDAAIEAALNDYTVDVKHEIKGRDDHRSKAQNQSKKMHNGDALQHSNNNAPKTKERKVEYFAVKLPATRVSAILDALFNDANTDVARMYRNLKQQRRVQAEFHVTLIHRATASQHQETWDHLSALHHAASQPASSSDTRAFITPEPKLGLCNVRFERLVWDSRVMAFVVRLVPGPNSKEQFSSTNATAHVTVGTAEPAIKPKEANDLLARWLREGSGPTSGIAEMAVKGNVELEGTVRGVLSR